MRFTIVVSSATTPFITNPTIIMSAKQDQTKYPDEQEYDGPKDQYEEAGDAYEDKLDRQKGDGRDKQAPSHQSKPKSVRN